MKYNDNKLGASILLALFIAYVYFIGDIHLDFWAEEETFHARTFPYLIGFAGITLSVLTLILTSDSTGTALPGLQRLPSALMLVVMVSGYGLVLDVLGFIITSILFLMGSFTILGERQWLRMSITATALVVCFWLLMSSLDIYLASGIWWDATE
ncbi:MAG TPA: hypothetical protein DCM54_04030 [Gammaproteobacteria bacterium]|nr:hypothetical protein [Gammaproteobacteria bacterium]